MYTTDRIPIDLLRPAPMSAEMRSEILAQRRRSKFYSVRRKNGSEFRVLVREPRIKTGKEPVVLWIHGGAYWTGSSEWIFNNMANQLAENCLTVAPDYALGPYPGGLNDCLTTLQWIFDNASLLGVDTDKLIVGGDSAGGAMAVAVCLYCRDNDGPKISLQIPLYPMLDYRMILPSAKDNDAPGWSSADNRRAWNAYLSEVGSEVPVYASPGIETDYKGLPPCITMAGSIEVFRDETELYVRNLEKAGIWVRFKEFPGAYHMFDVNAPESEYAREAREFFNQAFDYALKHFINK